MFRKETLFTNSVTSHTTQTLLRMTSPYSRWMQLLIQLSTYLYVFRQLGQILLAKQVNLFFLLKRSNIFIAWVTGWGTTKEYGDQATILQELELKVVDDQTCYDAMTGALGTFWG